ncbi:hypothetical protein LXL04_032315 [Taraxacum kok-saghyz]
MPLFLSFTARIRLRPMYAARKENSVGVVLPLADLFHVCFQDIHTDPEAPSAPPIEPSSVFPLYLDDPLLRSAIRAFIGDKHNSIITASDSSHPLQSIFWLCLHRLRCLTSSSGITGYTSRASQAPVHDYQPEAPSAPPIEPSSVFPLYLDDPLLRSAIRAFIGDKHNSIITASDSSHPLQSIFWLCLHRLRCLTSSSGITGYTSRASQAPVHDYQVIGTSRFQHALPLARTRAPHCLALQNITQ